jgi:hypothetical protein
VPAELTVIWWRDIPAQVIARRDRTTARAVLSDRFQEAIDAAATRAGLVGTDDYLNEWRRVSGPCDEGLDAVVAREVERLEAAYPDERLESIAKAGGVAG